MSQPQITSFVTKTTVGKLVNSTEKLDQTSETVFETNLCNTNANGKPNPNKRPRTCISDSSDHSVCIEKDLEEIKKSMENIVRKDDIAEIVTNIMGKLLDKWKMEIKKEIMVEVNKETTKIKEIYEKKLTNMSKKMDKIELENVNLLEKNSLLHTEVRQIREDMTQIEHTATESLRMANWNEQYSRKKNIKIYNLKESRGEQLIQDFVSSIKDSVKVEIRPSEIVAMHRIPGKPGSPRPVIVKFLRMENKITILKNRKALQEKLDIKIGDDITHKNHELLGRLNRHENITSAWYFNGHIYGTDMDGDRHRFDIFDNINQKLRK